MKILHTSDWHLGQKFLNTSYNSREQEHQLALDWLKQTIIEQSVDCLIIAGDIFDIGNPPNYARRMYYLFLRDMLDTQCRHIVITGGNHDSPSMLNAPKELLQTLNVHLIGCATGDIEDEIIELRNEAGKLEAVVAAVPFLRDKDLRYSYAGESGEDRIQRLRTGLKAHYVEAGNLVEKYAQQKIPIIATGHLYVKDALSSDRQDNIYIGDKENISAKDFPKAFDYVALGHIHRAQTLGDFNHIRYCGSLIPLSFSETKDDKSVYLLEFEGKKLATIQPLQLPIFRRLKTIVGDLDYVKSRLTKLATDYENHLTTWVEVMVETDKMIPNLDQILYDHTAEMNLELLKVRVKRMVENSSIPAITTKLDDFLPIDVFKQKCVAHYNGNEPEEMQELETTFRELEEWVQQSE